MKNNKDPFLNINDTPKMTSKNSTQQLQQLGETKSSDGTVYTSNPPSEDSNSYKGGKIVLRKMFTMTTFRVYLPSGKMYPVKSQSWFDKTEQPVVKKKPKKKLSLKKTKIKNQEVY